MRQAIAAADVADAIGNNKADITKYTSQITQL